MDQIEMMMQKYGDKLQIGYKALRELIPVFAPDYGFIKSFIGD